LLAQFPGEVRDLGYGHRAEGYLAAELGQPAGGLVGGDLDACAEVSLGKVEQARSRNESSLHQSCKNQPFIFTKEPSRRGSKLSVPVKAAAGRVAIGTPTIAGRGNPLGAAPQLV
jgi:hypothetical protein